MPAIELNIVIRAPRERVFDLARSIDAHQHTTGGTDERAVAGVTSGLIGMGDEVSWEARHFGIRQRLTVRVTAFDRPKHFQDIMISGAFKSMVHDHSFAEHPSGTLMRDRFQFTSPLGLLGRMVDWLFLEGYMRRFLVGRNEVLKRLAESPEGDNYLGQSRPASEPRTASSMAAHKESISSSLNCSASNKQTINHTL
jgi:ligand-binding SRPBCC domain-containing protein